MRPRLQVIQDDLVAEIVSNAKTILGEIGIEVRGQKLRQRLLEHGLPSDQNGRILFPPDVVDKAIAATPSSFDLFDRDGNRHAKLGGDNVHFAPGSSGLKILDHRTGATRLANTKDLVEYVRLADGLPNIACLATAFSTNDDIDPLVADAWRLYICLTNSLKPIVSGAFTEHGVPRMAEMMQLFRHDRSDLAKRPLAIFTITATGMFRYSEDSCQNLLDCVNWGIPVEIVPVTLMGLIAPVTLVGATVFHTADVLAGLTMCQILKPGMPLLFGGAPAAFHMKATTSPMAAIEALHLVMAYVTVAKSLNLPTQAYTALSDGKFLDAQAGAETFGGALLAALSGINCVSGPGMLDYLLVFSLEKLILDDELCGQALELVREMKPMEDLPTTDLVRELLEEQHLITAEHTGKYWPQELHLPSPVIDRKNREDWIKHGSRTLERRANDEVERRLAAYEQIHTEPETDSELRRIILSGKTEARPLPEIPIHMPASPGSATRESPSRQRARRRRKKAL